MHNGGMTWIRTTALALLGLVVLGLGLALGLVALGLALVLAPVAFLLARWFLGRAQVRGREVYEGEFRVLEEQREPEKGS